MAMDDRDWFRESRDLHRSKVDPTPEYDPREFRKPMSFRGGWRMTPSNSHFWRRVQAAGTSTSPMSAFFAVAIVVGFVTFLFMGYGPRLIALINSSPMARALPASLPPPSPMPAPPHHASPQASPSIVAAAADPFPPAGTARYHVPIDRMVLVSTLHVDADAAMDPGTMLLVRITNATTAAVFADLHLRPGYKVEIGLPPGYFRLTSYMGTNWIDRQRLFGPTSPPVDYPGVVTSGPGGVLRVALTNGGAQPPQARSRHQ